MLQQKRYLCWMVRGKILGIDVKKLENDDEQKVDWESLPTFPFDFAREVPLIRSLCLVLDDSKIILVGGKRIIHGDNRWGPWTSSCKTYLLELDITGNKKKPGYEMTEIAESPKIFGPHFSFAVEIKGDYYFLVYGSVIPSPKDVPFWVLRSESGEWECLPAPPLPKEFALVVKATWFLFQDKLYLLTLSSTSVNHELEDEFMEDEHVEDDFEEDDGAVEDDEFVEDDSVHECEGGEPEDEHVEDEMEVENVGDDRVNLCSFDPGTNRWTQYNDDDDFMNSFGLIIDGERRFLTPRTEVFSVPGLSDSNCTLTLSCSYLEELDVNFYGFPIHQPAIIHALLVSHKKGVRLFQPIQECFSGIQPTFLTFRPFIQDLGDGKVCAMLFGFVKEHDGGESPVLCSSVFSLAMENGLDIDNKAPPKKQNFLTVHVLGKRVYSMKDCLYCAMKDYFEALQLLYIPPPPPTKRKDKEIPRKRKELPS